MPSKDNALRVLMFGWEFPPHISGGLGTACHQMTQALTRHGVRVTFVIPRAPELRRRSHVRLVSAAHVPPQPPASGTRATTTPPRTEFRAVESLLRPYLTETTYRQVLDSAMAQAANHPAGTESILAPPSPYGPNLIAEVARYSDASEHLGLHETFDIIHAHDWMTFPAAIRAMEISRKPLVVHIHALEFDRSGEHGNPDIIDIEKAGMLAANHVIAVSHYTRQLILDRYGIDPGKVSVVHNAVPHRRVNTVYHVDRKRTGKIVLFLGRVTSQKGPDYFVEAAARVLQKMPYITFVMAGAGDMLPRLIERVGELRIGNRFHFTGFLQGHDVERMYAMSDLYVLPSVSEPFGISPLEAMIYDIPVIVSRNAGVGEVLPHALKVDFWDVDDIAGKILSVFKYPALTREMLRHGKEDLKTIRWSMAAARLLDIYNRLTPPRHP
jgi:glycogen(starch) synthase